MPIERMDDDAGRDVVKHGCAAVIVVLGAIIVGRLVWQVFA